MRNAENIKDYINIYINSQDELEVLLEKTEEKLLRDLQLTTEEVMKSKEHLMKTNPYGLMNAQLTPRMFVLSYYSHPTI